MNKFYIVAFICLTFILSACSQSKTPTKKPEVTFSAPVISKVETRNDSNTTSGKVIFIDVSYNDVDGDATIIDLEIISTTGTDTFVTDGILSASAEQQKAGAVSTSTWTCGLNQKYEVEVSFQVKDAKDKVSNLVQQKIVCD